MDDLAAFIEARLDEDEAAPDVHAEGCALHAWLRNDVPSACDCGYPARVLREVAAKRAILERHAPHQPAFGGLACNWCSEDVDDRPSVAKEPWPCDDIRAIAAVWSDHPDYRAEWVTGHG